MALREDGRAFICDGCAARVFSLHRRWDGERTIWLCDACAGVAPEEQGRLSPS